MDDPSKVPSVSDFINGVMITKCGVIELSSQVKSSRHCL